MCKWRGAKYSSVVEAPKWVRMNQQLLDYMGWGQLSAAGSLGAGLVHDTRLLSFPSFPVGILHPLMRLGRAMRAVASSEAPQSPGREKTSTRPNNQFGKKVAINDSAKSPKSISHLQVSGIVSCKNCCVFWALFHCRVPNFFWLAFFFLQIFMGINVRSYSYVPAWQRVECV